jgi:hypothetical protein
VSNKKSLETFIFLVNHIFRDGKKGIKDFKHVFQLGVMQICPVDFTVSIQYCASNFWQQKACKTVSYPKLQLFTSATLPYQKVSITINKKDGCSLVLPSGTMSG